MKIGELLSKTQKENHAGDTALGRFSQAAGGGLVCEPCLQLGLLASMGHSPEGYGYLGTDPADDKSPSAFSTITSKNYFIFCLSLFLLQSIEEA